MTVLMSGRMCRAGAVLLIVVAACTSSKPHARKTSTPAPSASASVSALVSITTIGGGPAHLGDRLVFTGTNLRGATRAFFSNARLSAPIALGVYSSTETSARVRIPSGSAAASRWVAGRYQVVLLVPRGRGTAQTNTIAFALAPRIISPMPMRVPIRDYYTTATATVRLRVSPAVRPGQIASLIIAGGRVVAAGSRNAATDTLTFVVDQASPETFAVWLRVDGVDSIRTTGTKSYDPSQQITFYVP